MLPPPRHEATLLILRSQVAFAAVAVLIKFASESLAVPVVTGWVLLFGPGFAFLYCLYCKQLQALRSVRWRWAWLRAALVVMGGVCSFYGFATLELANAIALSFLAPLFITALAIPLLGEHVGWHRRGAILVGLIGVLCIVKSTSFAVTQALPVYDLGVMAMIVSALCFALSTIIMKRQLRREPPAVNFLAVELCVGLLALPCFGLPMLEQLPDAKQASLLLLLATLSCLGVICNSEAHSRTEASYLAPFTYLQLLWVALAGLLIWGQWPDYRAWFGIALIVTGGLYTARREKVLGISR